MKLFAETEVLTKTEKENAVEKQAENLSASQEAEVDDQEVENEKVLETEEYQTEYIKSFSNLTLGDMTKKDEEEKQQEFEKEKEELIKQQYEEKKQEEKVIEKPNYDLIETNKKVLKLSKKQEQKLQTKPRKRGKKFKIALTVGLAISAILCLTNITLLDNYSNTLSNLETEFYEVNLPKYLKNIANLDTTQKSMEFLETYPEEMNDAGDLGEKSNWFDKFCNFISRLFGG